MINGWQTVELGNVMRLEIDAVPVDSQPEFQMAGVYSFARGLFKREALPNTQTTYKFFHRLHKDMFVISVPKGWEGALARVTEDFDGMFLSPVFPTFRANPRELDVRYFEWYCRQSKIWDELRRKSRGIGARRESISAEKFLSLEIPLPPLGEQHRIVERVEFLAARVTKAQSLREDANEETEQLFINTISNLPIDEKDWLTVGALLSSQKGSIHSGPFGSDLTHDQFVESGVAAIGTRDVQVNRFSMTRGWFVTPERFESLKQYQIHPNDVLVTIIGGSIGRFCVVPDDVPLAFTTKHIIAMKFDPALVLPTFASYLLNYHRRCRETMFSQTAGSAQPSLNASKVKAIHFPKLSLDEQRRIVAYLDSVQARLASLRELQSQTHEELDALLPSVLDRAFKGEL